MLSVAKVYAGRGAVAYYLGQTRRGLADYYLPDTDLTHDGVDARAQLTAPGSSWWGGGAEALELSGPVTREAFEPLYGSGERPDGIPLGRRFRTSEQADASKDRARDAVAAIGDPYERWMADHRVRTRGSSASVAGWDCVFSPVKSVSVLWAAGTPELQREIWAAHETAVEAALDYLEEHGSYVRAGRNGVRVLESTGLVVARLNEWTSRDADPQMHTHCLVLNRARTREDGKWRALDGRALLATRAGASALYDRIVEAELTRRLGVRWRDRPDGLREIDGIDQRVLRAFSSRRFKIAQHLEVAVADHEERYGSPPDADTLAKLAQRATWQTRRRKRDPQPAASRQRWASVAGHHGQPFDTLPTHVLGRHRAAPADDADHHASLSPLLAAVRRLHDDGNTSLTRHQLLRAALDVIPPDGHTPASLRAAGERLVARLQRTGMLLELAAPEVLTIQPGLTRSDGTSVYTRPARERWTLTAQLDHEAWLLDVATERAGSGLPGPVVDAALTRGNLGAGQAHAVRRLATDQRRIGLLVGAAGTGKTSTLAALVEAHTTAGIPVVGLTVSQAAADVLADLGNLRAENTAKWLRETRHGRWQLPDGGLLLIDEASMLPTDQLVELVAQARTHRSRIVLVGDPAQLPAVGAGGAFALLCDRHDPVELTEVRRFTQPWEATASLQLRDRDPSAIAAYAMRDRIHGAPTDQIEPQLFDAWLADTLTPDEHGRRRDVLMIVGTNDQAARLARQARAALVAAGIVEQCATVPLADNLASVGDLIVTRRNDRHTVDQHGRWVVNGDTWRITTVHPDGAVTAVRAVGDGTVRLDPSYLAADTHLAYATTVHRTQGRTVDSAHTLVTEETNHGQLYVAATRGRDANHLWIATDPARGQHDPPDPEQLLAAILRRRDASRRAAHHTLEDLHDEVGSLARLNAIYEDVATQSTSTWLRHQLTDRGLGVAVEDAEWVSLVTACRRHALAGHDLAGLLDRAIAHRPLDDADSIAGVLHWRFDHLAPACVPVRPPGRPGALLDLLADPYRDIAEEAAKLIDLEEARIHREHAAGSGEPPRWARLLGSRPTEPDAARTWIDAITLVDVYRRTYDLERHVELVGPPPTIHRPEAARTHAEAQRLCDHVFARHLGQLDVNTRNALLERQRDLLDNAPPFDPAELAAIHRQLAVARQSHGAPEPGLEGRLADLERRAETYSRWLNQTVLARHILKDAKQARSTFLTMPQLSRRP